MMFSNSSALQYSTETILQLIDVEYEWHNLDVAIHSEFAMCGRCDNDDNCLQIIT